MTESEWLTCEWPIRMLSSLVPSMETTRRMLGIAGPIGSISDRQLRFFSCACCRVAGALSAVVDEYEREGPPDRDEIGGGHTDLVWARGWTEVGQNKPTLAVRADILRDIVGNPFRQQDLVIAVDNPMAYQSAVSVARSIYEQRSFEDMPILADALLDAGCTSEYVLQHCREKMPCPSCEGRGWIWNDNGGNVDKGHCLRCDDSGWVELRTQHVRGCWVLDLLLDNRQDDVEESHLVARE